MNTKLDQNRIPVIIAVSNADGQSIINVCADDTKHALCVENGSTGSGDPTINDHRDENRKVAFMVVSAVDGVTPVEIYANSLTNKLLINKN